LELEYKSVVFTTLLLSNQPINQSRYLNNNYFGGKIMTEQIEWQDIQLSDDDATIDEYNNKLSWALKPNVLYYDVDNIWDEELLLNILELTQELLTLILRGDSKYYELVKSDGFMEPWDNIERISDLQFKTEAQLDRLYSNNPEDVIRRCVAFGAGI
jgi:hypothetical protein